MKLAAQFIKAALEADTDIVAKVSSRIFPIAATAGTKDWPFITHTHSSTGMEPPTKDDGTHCRLMKGMVTVVARNASEAQDIADMIYPAMCNYLLSDDNTFDEFDDLDFVSEEEDYIPDIDSFAVKVTFTFNYLS